MNCSALWLCIVIAAASEACNNTDSLSAIPLPAEQTPRICAGQERSVSGMYPTYVPGVLSLVMIQLAEGRDPATVKVNWTVQINAAPIGVTDALVRDSRDTTRVLLTFTRLEQPSPYFAFAGSATALNGTLDPSSSYDVINAGAAEIVFLTSPSSKIQGRIPLTPQFIIPWLNRVC